MVRSKVCDMGVRPLCKLCRNEQEQTTEMKRKRRELYAFRSEKVNATRRSYYKENKQKVKGINKRWADQNKEELNSKAKSYREGNKRNLILAKKKEYHYAKSPEQKAADNQRGKEFSRNAADSVSLGYAKDLMKRNNPKMVRKDIPDWMARLKRQEIINSRKLKQLNDEINK